MSHYRLFVLGPDNHIVEPPAVIEAETDQAAVEAASQLLDRKLLEVWCLKRLVARLEPNRPRRGLFAGW